LQDPGGRPGRSTLVWSGISSGTERLLWAGPHADLPGHGLSAGAWLRRPWRTCARRPAGLCRGPAVVVRARCQLCQRGREGLFGGAAGAHQVLPAARRGEARRRGARGRRSPSRRHATAHHARGPARLPQLIVGHGVLGRCWHARVTLALGGHRTHRGIETQTARHDGAAGLHASLHTATRTTRRDYADDLRRPRRRGPSRHADPAAPERARSCSAGFYEEPLSFTFPPAFMREASIRMAAEFTTADLQAVQGAGGTAAPLEPRRAHQPPRSPPPHCGTGLRRRHSPILDCIKMALDLERIRPEQHRPRHGRATATPEEGAQIIAIYGKGGIGKSFTLANLSYMMAAAGQARAADRLRSEERHHLAAVRRQGLPDDHRDLGARRSWRAKRCRSATSASSATASSRWSWAARRSAAAAAGAASSTASSCSRSSASMNGASTTSCSISWATWSAAASACRSRATCARRSIVVGSNDLQSLYVANNVCSAVEYFRKLGGNVGVAGHRHQQGRRHRRGRRPSPRRSAFRCWPRSRPTRTSAARRANYEIIGRPGARMGAAVRRAGRQRRRAPRRVRPKPLDSGRAARPVRARR